MSLVANGSSVAASGLIQGCGGSGGLPWTYTTVSPTAYNSHLRGDCAASARFWHCSTAAVLAVSSLGCAVTHALNPPTLSANALKSVAGTYSLPSDVRARSLTNGTFAAANFSVEAIGGGEGAGGAGGVGADDAALDAGDDADAAFCAGAGVGAGAGTTNGEGFALLAGAATLTACVSSLVK